MADLEVYINVVESRHAGGVDLFSLLRVSLHRAWLLQLEPFSYTL